MEGLLIWSLKKVVLLNLLIILVLQYIVSVFKHSERDIDSWTYTLLCASDFGQLTYYSKYVISRKQLSYYTISTAVFVFWVLRSIQIHVRKCTY